MSTAVFPSLPGLGWSVRRTEVWQTRKQEAISGKRTSIADWSFPRHQWELKFDFLRQAGANQQASSFAGAQFAEFASLAGFFNLRSGGFDSFLYVDPDDIAVAGQVIATGDGSTQKFPMVRSFGGYVEPVYGFTAVSAVRLNGVAQAPGSLWNVTSWGGVFVVGGGASGDPPGVLTFATAPAAGAVIAADFAYAFPCQFDEDGMGFEKFMAALYSARSVKFSSLK